MKPHAHVIFLHGLARTALSFHSMARFFQKQNFATHNLNYPSRKFEVETLSEKFLKPQIVKIQKDNPKATLHFITHSLGGILLRFYLSKDDIKNLGRIVMLAPPNQGSEIVDKLSHWPGFKKFNGPAGLQLGTKPNHIPQQLKPLETDVGIIAGSKTVNLILSQLLPKPNDGKVSVASTQLQEMKDFLVTPHSHTFLMQRKKIWQHSLNFLNHGEFL